LLRGGAPATTAATEAIPEAKAPPKVNILRGEKHFNFKNPF
jgi:hypothetical protein